MNVTISIDDDLLRRAREHAKTRGISLQELLREQLRRLVGPVSEDESADELMRLMEDHGGHSGGRRIRRDEAYDERL